jgi:hypothetical protein
MKNGKITPEDLERIMTERRIIEAAALEGKAFPDLVQWLHALPYYKPGNGKKENHTFHEDLVLFNATVFVDDPFTMPHQGDITTDTIRGIKSRLGQHTVYIFWEHNDCKPMCGPFDLTALNPMAGMAKPFGDRTIQLRMADIIIKGDRAIINENVNDLPFKKAGFNVEQRLNYEELDENFKPMRQRGKC